MAKILKDIDKISLKKSKAVEILEKNFTKREFAFLLVITAEIAAITCAPFGVTPTLLFEKKDKNNDIYV